MTSKPIFFHKYLLILVLIPFSCFFQPTRAHADTNPRLFKAVDYAGATLGLSTGTAADEYHFFVQADFQYNLYDWTFYAGAQGTKESGGITLSVQYWPFTWEHTRLGPKLIYNLDIYSDISITNNILPGITFECQPVSWFSFSIDTFYLFKGRYIYALEDEGFVPVNTFAYSQHLNFYLPCNITLTQYVATYSTFRYTQPADLEIGLKVSWDMNQSWQFTAEAVSRQIIYYLFTTAFTAGEFKLGARYIF